MFRPAALLLICSLPALANQRLNGWCQQGGQAVITAGITSTTVAQITFTGKTVTVYLNNTLTLATIYSDNMNTAKANPFTASSDGSWFFYAANGRYDVTCTGGGTNLSYLDNLLFDVGGANFITSLNGLTASVQTFATGTTGSNFNIVSSGSTHTFNFPNASASNRGLLLAADWSTFNGKQATITVTAPITLTGGNTIGASLPFTISQGGTGQITANAAFNTLSPLTTVGDLLGSNGSANVRVGVGADNTILLADHTQGVGFRWASCTFCSLTTPLSVANGGTGQASGTNGGIPCYTGSTTIASSSLLASGNPLIGAGAGACPSTTGPFTSYNSLALAGQGMPVILSAPALSATQSATVGPTSMVASTNAGTYELCYYAVITQAATSSSSLTPSFTWNDGSARSTSTTVSSNAPQFQAYTGNVAGTVLSGCTTVASAATQSITYTLTYASTGGTAMNYVYLVTAKEIR